MPRHSPSRGGEIRGDIDLSEAKHLRNVGDAVGLLDYLVRLTCVPELCTEIGRGWFQASSCEPLPNRVDLVEGRSRSGGPVVSSLGNLLQDLLWRELTSPPGYLTTRNPDTFRHLVPPMCLRIPGYRPVNAHAKIGQGVIVYAQWIVIGSLHNCLG
jgi:hypothetical protein